MEFFFKDEFFEIPQFFLEVVVVGDHLQEGPLETGLSYLDSVGFFEQVFLEFGEPDDIEHHSDCLLVVWLFVVVITLSVQFVFERFYFSNFSELSLYQILNLTITGCPHRLPLLIVNQPLALLIPYLIHDPQIFIQVLMLFILLLGYFKNGTSETHP